MCILYDVVCVCVKRKEVMDLQLHLLQTHSIQNYLGLSSISIQIIMGRILID